MLLYDHTVENMNYYYYYSLFLNTFYPITIKRNQLWKIDSCLITGISSSNKDFIPTTISLRCTISLKG